MTTATVSAFDTTLHKTNAWLKDVMKLMDWEDHHRAYQALRAVLHALRDRMTVNEANDLAAQLPMLVRGFYFEGWKPAHTPVPEHTLEAFLKHVSDAFREDPSVDPEQLTRAVFATLEKHITAGELADVKATLPAAIRAIWT